MILLLYPVNISKSYVLGAIKAMESLPGSREAWPRESAVKPEAIFGSTLL